MKVKVIKAGNLMDVLQMIASMVCSECNCEYGEPVQTQVGSAHVNLDFFIGEIAKKKGWKLERALGWLNGIAELSPIAAFNIVVREIAIWLDKQYEDHIENSEKIYVISTFDGRIHEVCKKYIKNYRNFAAFRTIEDAKFACNLLRGQLKSMFTSNAKRK